jgi:hypothetical protein
VKRGDTFTISGTFSESPYAKEYWQRVVSVSDEPDGVTIHLAPIPTPPAGTVPDATWSIAEVGEFDA